MMGPTPASRPSIRAALAACRSYSKRDYSLLSSILAMPSWPGPGPGRHGLQPGERLAPQIPDLTPRQRRDAFTSLTRSGFLETRPLPGGGKAVRLLLAEEQEDREETQARQGEDREQAGKRQGRGREGTGKGQGRDSWRTDSLPPLIPPLLCLSLCL